MICILDAHADRVYFVGKKMGKQLKGHRNTHSGTRGVLRFSFACLQLDMADKRQNPGLEPPSRCDSSHTEGILSAVQKSLAFGL